MGAIKATDCIIILFVSDDYGLYYTLLYYFGTNLLTGGPVPVAVFLPISVFPEKEYQTESKRNETFARIFLGTNAIQETWIGRQGRNEAATR